MQLRSVLTALAALAPLEHAEPWDNVGLLCGDPEQDVRGVLCCIDLTSAVLAEAGARAADLVVAYHPPLFKPMARLPHHHVLVQAWREGRAVYSPHTALDVAAGGTNDVLAAAAGCGSTRPLRPSAAGGGEVGIGRVGDLPAALALASLVARLKDALGLRTLLTAVPGVARPLQRVALCAGAGGDLIDAALVVRADVFVTGELRHHEALRLQTAGTAAICTLHSQSERAALAPLAQRLREACPGVVVAASERDCDPFQFA